MALQAQHYALITDYGTKIYENLTISNNTIKIYVDDKTIGNGLGNNDDYIIPHIKIQIIKLFKHMSTYPHMGLK
jgi:hypothetical protein